MLRFAVSPTGDLDIGNLRVAIFNYILSKQKNEELIIRIDDTDKKNNIENKDKEILELLNLFGIEHSRVIIQSENIKYHTGMAMNLLLDKKAFNCFCSEEVLAEEKKEAKKSNKTYSYSGFCETISDETKFNCNAPFVVRLKKPEDSVKFSDFLKDEVKAQPYEVDSLVILDFDKSPTANFASAVDDMIYNISTVVSGESELSNTAKQIHVRKAMGYDKDLEYMHIPNISNKILVKDLVDEGYLPAAIANYIVLLGYETPSEIFTIEEALEWFDINKISKSALNFDMDKLKTINNEHLKTLDNMRLSKLLGFADEDIGTLAKIYLQEANTLNELKDKIGKIFATKDNSEYSELQSVLKDMPYIDSFEKFESEAKTKSALEGDKFDTALRYVLTGDTKGPALSEIYPCIKNYLGEIV